ncbi:LA2681 family HEPN domain-containing protein [Stenotrophomonas sp. TWI700]|uniref:LA2681 family HEPN domain-containing protein n=1 Tax=Stenotrophomonas sp. TWI700 TaxID=3136792 RepID=UPI00320AB75A
MILTREQMFALADQLSVHAKEGTITPRRVDQLGALIDAAGESVDLELLQHCIDVIGQCGVLEDRRNGCSLHYLHANALGWLYIHRHTDENALSWSQPDNAAQIYQLRSAIAHEGYSEHPAEYRAQIHSNLGNAFNKTGRVFDALEQWRKALTLDPMLAMARGNMGGALLFYARNLYDAGHSEWICIEGRAQLRAAVAIGAHGATYFEAAERFQRMLETVESGMDQYGIDRNPDLAWMDKFSLGRSYQEKRYRRWCLDNRLFLNPMNDGYTRSVAATDSLAIPTHRADGVGISYLAAFNQLKQEYIYARWCLFAGQDGQATHPADREVMLSSNADSARYSIAIEQTTTAFRAAYSLLDKVAYFVRDRWEVDADRKDADFARLWKTKPKKNIETTIRSEFEESQNIWLHALCSLSEDIFNENTRRHAAPDAKELHIVRNSLEHRFFKIVWSRSECDEASMHHDRLSEQMPLDEFQCKALRVLVMARSAIMCLCFALHRAERQRQEVDDALAVSFGVQSIPVDLKGERTHLYP